MLSSVSLVSSRETYFSMGILGNMVNTLNWLCYEYKEIGKSCENDEINRLILFSFSFMDCCLRILSIYFLCQEN